MVGGESMIEKVDVYLVTVDTGHIESLAINIYSRLRFGLVNSNYNYLRLKFSVVWEVILCLKRIITW